jgi:hypothetical protein
MQVKLEAVHDKMGRLNHHSIIKLKEEGYKPLQIL